MSSPVTTAYAGSPSGPSSIDTVTLPQKISPFFLTCRTSNRSGAEVPDPTHVAVEGENPEIHVSYPYAAG